mgnify:FL=1
MNKDILNSITVLSKKIKYHDQKYHEQDNPEITDIDYDEICKKYDQLIQQHPEFIYLERKLIGSSPSIQFDKYTHQKPMGSLVNGFTIKDIEDFINRTNKFLSLKNNMPLEFMCEPKIDGLSISLSYHNGILLNGVTRGDGTTGEIVTNNIKTISDIPHKLKKEYPEFIEVRGEIFMSKNNFNILNRTQEAKGKNIFANPRNAAAGSIRQKDIKILNERKLNFNAFSVGEFSDDFKFETQSDLLKKLNHMGFLINIENIQVNNVDQIQKFYTKMLNKRNSLDYEIDGLVYKINSKEYQDRLGNLSRAPRWAIAHKLPAEIVETILTNIEIQVGRTGAITPVGKLIKTKVGGVLVSNVSLHNEDEIARKDIRIGDTVQIQRAGDVIPQIVKVIIEKRKVNSKKYIPSEFCPSCNNKTIKPLDEAVRRCIAGLDCPAQAIEKLKHFVSKNAFNIDGIGEKQIIMFYHDGIIKDFSDFFKISDHQKTLIKKEGFGELSVSKLINSIDSKKIITLDKLIYSLGIRQIGETSAKILSYHYNSYKKFCLEMINSRDPLSNSYQNLISIDQIGKSSADDLIQYFNSEQNLNMLDKLLKYIEIQDINFKSVNSPYSGKTIVLTGSLRSMSRDEAKSILQNMGAKVSNSISKNTDFVIVGDQAGSKAKKAFDLNIETINEEEWLKTINK